MTFQRWRTPRTSKTVDSSSEAFTWDVAEGLPLIIQDGSTRYLTGPGGLPLEQITGTTALYFHQDQLGSTRALTDSSGNVVATATYDTYGNLSASSGTATNPFGFAGQFADGETGLIYLRARYYDPSAGQFISRDPANAISRAPYVYAGDGPLNWSDPAGLWMLGYGGSGAVEIGIPVFPLEFNVSANIGCGIFSGEIGGLRCWAGGGCHATFVGWIFDAPNDNSGLFGNGSNKSLGAFAGAGGAVFYSPGAKKRSDITGVAPQTSINAGYGGRTFAVSSTPTNNGSTLYSYGGFPNPGMGIGGDYSRYGTLTF